MVTWKGERLHGGERKVDQGSSQELARSSLEGLSPPCEAVSTRSFPAVNLSPI